MSKYLYPASQLCSSFTTQQSHSTCSSLWVVLQHLGGQKWLNLIWCHNTFTVKQAPFASAKLMSLQDLHQTCLYTGTSPQNFLISMFSNMELIDICCIANCHYRGNHCLHKSGEGVSPFLRFLLFCGL